MSSAAQASKTKKITKTKKPSPKVKVFVETSSKRGSPEDLLNYPKEKENSKSPGKKSTPDKKDSSSSDLNAINKAKSEGAGKLDALPVKTKAEEYLSFFKYYYERLTVEHPRWTKPQITLIIKLLWKKRGSKTNKRRRSLSSSKPMSGRQLFCRTKISEGHTRTDARQIWKALPHESKVYWKIRGQGKPSRCEKDSGRFVRKVLNSGAV